MREQDLSQWTDQTTFLVGEIDFMCDGSNIAIDIQLPRGG